MKKIILPRKTLILWQLRALIAGILLIGIAFTVRVFVYFPVKFIGILAVVDLVCVVLTVSLYMPALFKTCKVELKKHGVLVERGVIFKNTHILPFSKLIYTQSYRTPVAKLMGLTAVSLKAARSRVFIPEMEKQDAEAFIEALAEGDDL